MTAVWVFNGVKSNFPSGVFVDREQADHWIRHNKLTGTLTKYPVGVGVYEWAIQQNYFEPKKPHEASPEFIGRFSDAAQEHYHYENGLSKHEAFIRRKDKNDVESKEIP